MGPFPEEVLSSQVPQGPCELRHGHIITLKAYLDQEQFYCVFEWMTMAHSMGPQSFYSVRDSFAKTCHLAQFSLTHTVLIYLSSS